MLPSFSQNSSTSGYPYEFNTAKPPGLHAFFSLGVFICDTLIPINIIAFNQTIESIVEGRNGGFDVGEAID